MNKNNIGLNNIIVISSINQAKKLKIDNYNNPILCMNANIFFFLKKKINNIKKSYLIKFELTKEEEEEITRVSSLEYFRNINSFQNYSVSLSSMETIKVLLLQNLYSLNAIYLFISKYKGFYYYEGNTLQYTNSKEKVINSIFSSNQEENSFKRNSQINIKFKSIIILVNKLIFFLNRNKKMIWIIAKQKPIEIFLDSLNKNKKNSDRIYAYYYYKNNQSLFIKIFKSLFCSLIKKTIIPIFPVRKEVIIDKSKIKSIILISLNNQLKKFSDIILINILNSIKDAESIESYTYEFLRNYKIHLLITDQIRWKDGTGVAAACKRRDIPVFLISHNTHSIPNTEISEKIQFQNSNGLLNSKLSTYNIIQSEQAYLLYKKYFDQKKIIKSSPIMWGYYNLNKKKNNENFTIVIADTIKRFYTIPYIYEDSFGYIKNIKEILDKLEEFDNIKKIIKFRPDESLNSQLIFEISKNYKNTHISIKESFLDIMKNSNLLISHSSTTIEETLNLNIPVALYEGKNKYQHISAGNNDSEFIYFLNKKNFHDKIKKILMNANRMNNINNYNDKWITNNNNVIMKINEYCK